MLAHITERTDNTCTNDANRTKPNTFHEAFCKAGIDQKGVTSIALKIAQSMQIGGGDPQQVRGSFANKRNKNYRAF